MNLLNRLLRALGFAAPPDGIIDRRNPDHQCGAPCGQDRRRMTPKKAAQILTTSIEDLESAMGEFRRSKHLKRNDDTDRILKQSGIIHR